MSEPKLLAVVGGKHSGKTTIIENLIAELNRRGFRVGTIKEMVRVPALDTPGKETDRYAQAGAEVVAAVPRCETVVFIKKRLEIKEIISYFAELDVVLLEGFECERVLPKVVAAKTIAEAQSYVDDKTVAVSGLLAESIEDVWDLKVPLLSCRSQIVGLVDLVAQKALRVEF